jgi:ParB family chromosome partitioning protein
MKKALGKGIKAFIPEEYGILKDEKYAEIDIERLKPNPLQPRTKFDEKAIDELARSIKEAGVLQPILCVPEDEYFKILTGERRWRAAQKAGLQKVPVLIRNIPQEQQLEISLIENLQREELNPIEIARAYQRLIDELNYTQQDVGDKVGKDRTSVTNFLRLLKLPGEVQEGLKDGRISMGHARALLAVEVPEAQVKLCRKIIKKNLSVRDVERLVSKRKPSAAPLRRAKSDPNLEALQEDLLRFLGTKVDIAGNQKRGVIKIFYFSLDELNRIFELIKGVNS